MKLLSTLILASGAVFLLCVPADAQRIECLMCDSEYWEEGGEWHTRHRFDSSGQGTRECEGVPEDPEHQPSGPAVKLDGCSSCHNDWVEEEDCVGAHPPCSSGGGGISDLVTQVEALLGSSYLLSSRELESAISLLGARLFGTAALRVEPEGGLLVLYDCAGIPIRTWQLPS